MSVADPIATPKPTDGQRGVLEAELAELRKQQRRAFELAIYIGMSAVDSQEYERRAHKISQLQIALGVKPKVTIGLW